MTARLALPTGDARKQVLSLLQGAGIAVPGYEPDSRVLRSHDEDRALTYRIFRERDIPVQVALGNYDLGICSEVFLAESRVRFPLQQVVRLGALAGGESEVWVAGAPGQGLVEGSLPSADALAGARIVSELPALADWFATHARIPGYRMLPLYGSSDAYPPEDAELAVLPTSGAEAVRNLGLVPLVRLFRGGLALIANTNALANHNLGALLPALQPLIIDREPDLSTPAAPAAGSLARARRRSDVVRLALPDGHAQRHTYAGLQDAGLQFEGYEEKAYVRRPASGIEGLEIKVVRPQDMSQLVAMGMFDLAVTGVDWMTDHLARFPDSPVEMAVDLGRSRYRIGPVVDAAFPADTTAEALRIWSNLGRPVRIASEYPALSERFARQNHLHYTAIIPINGASEGFVPEDADILIEGSETGSSIRANNLKMLDPFMESTNCVITRSEPVTERTELLASLIDRLRSGVAVPA